ncbi:PAZ domain-containing protein, partial [Tanacetum coccineum]
MKFLSDSYGSSHLGNLLLAYDGKQSAFAAGPLPFDSKDFVVKLAEQNGREREFKVTIKVAARKELDHLRQFLAGRQQDNPQETIQALDAVFREIVGRSLFHTDFGRGPLGDGIEYRKGFYQSLRPTQMGLSLNIDVSARAFYESKLLSEFVGEFLGKDMSRPLADQDRIKVKRALKRVRVEVRRQDYKRRYKVQGLTAQPISQLNFTDETATKTVVQYFREKYNVQLRFPALPAVPAGTDAKPTYLPMEICWVVPGQRYALKLNERQVTQFLRATCQRPKDREDSIDNAMKHNKYNKDPLVSKDFEMNVTELLTSIEARVLPPPPLRYHESGCSSEVHPSVGVWNMIHLKVINGGTVNYRAVINFSRQNEQAVGRFVNGLVSMCQTKGILAKSAPGHHLQMLFVILPEAKGTYPRIKRVCETELGIVSQCCKPQHIMKMSNQYFENVALKINVKVGRRNTVLSATLNGRLPYVTDRPTIIFGADVTHPGEDSSPSIAAVVASMDWPQVTKYKALVSAQSHRQEIINDLYTTSTDPKRGIIHGGLIRELLKSFKRSTGHKLHRIVFYRDGFSEGQFNEVLLNEMDKNRKACISLEENYMPPATFIVVQKRHHTRFFPVRHGDRASTDRSGNILPGTVVDTKICHPSEFDFYLCSHAGIQEVDEQNIPRFDCKSIGIELQKLHHFLSMHKVFVTASAGFFGGGGPKRIHDTGEPSTSTSVSNLVPRTMLGTLLERIRRYDFELIPVDGDGSCQYRSLSVAINGTEDDYMEVKDKILTEIEANPGLYQDYGITMGMEACQFKESYDNFVRGLREDGAWGNIMTLFAFTNVYHVRATMLCSIAGELERVMEEVVPIDFYINFNKEDALRRRSRLLLPPPPPRNLGRFELVVKNLPLFVTSENLRAFFAIFGVRNTYVMSRHGPHRGVGFVRMMNENALENAVSLDCFGLGLRLAPDMHSGTLRFAFDYRCGI